MIHNPILKGFNPDPSIVRVGDDYYSPPRPSNGIPACRFIIPATW
jgi:xylan 1,4-beta-xylosidase